MHLISSLMELWLGMSPRRCFDILNNPPNSLLFWNSISNFDLFQDTTSELFLYLTCFNFVSPHQSCFCTYNAALWALCPTNIKAKHIKFAKDAQIGKAEMNFKRIMKIQKWEDMYNSFCTDWSQSGILLKLNVSVGKQGSLISTT